MLPYSVLIITHVAIWMCNILLWSQKVRSSTLILRYVVLSYHITIHKFRRNYSISSKINIYYYTWICRQCIQKKILLFSEEILVFSSFYIFLSKCKVLAWLTQFMLTSRYSRVTVWFDFHEQKTEEKVQNKSTGTPWRWQQLACLPTLRRLSFPSFVRL